MSDTSVEGRVALRVRDFDAAIFDMDGVVTRTATVHAIAWKRLFDDYLEERMRRGEPSFVPFDPDADYRLYVDGRPRYDGVQAFLDSRAIRLPRGDATDPPTAATVCGLGNRKDALFLAEMREHGVAVYPSTVDLINALKAAGVRVGIFSASRNAATVLDAAGVLDLFEQRVDGLIADELLLPGKPDPAMLLELTRRLAAAPTRTAVFEDAIAGVRAGKAGGFGMVIGVNRSSHPGALRENGADVEVDDLSRVALAV